MALDLAAALDPVRFAERCGVVADHWQAEVLRSEDPRILLNCSRQAGKSTVAAVLALHRAVYWPASLVLLVSPSLRQSSELFRVALTLYGRAGLPAPVEASAQRMELANGSRVVSLPGSEATIRGFSGASLLILDEASRIEDALYHAVTPMLATTGGRLIALSTPFGRRGWWAEAWHGRGAWSRVRITAEDVPRISPVFLAEQRVSMGEFWFRQEFLCEFMDAASAAFRMTDIEQAQAEEVEVWQV
jgi:hypothetical protein